MKFMAIEFLHQRIQRKSPRKFHFVKNLSSGSNILFLFLFLFYEIFKYILKYMLQVLKFAKIMSLSVLLYSLLFNLKNTTFFLRRTTGLLFWVVVVKDRFTFISSLTTFKQTKHLKEFCVELISIVLLRKIVLFLKLMMQNHQEREVLNFCCPLLGKIASASIKQAAQPFHACGVFSSHAAIRRKDQQFASAHFGAFESVKYPTFLLNSVTLLQQILGAFKRGLFFLIFPRELVRI